MSNILNIDKEGFIRKPSDTTSGIICWLAGVTMALFAGFISEMSFLIALILIYGALLSVYESISAFSTYDIKTWKCNKHIKFWICAPSIITGWFGVIMYYYFKRKERKYLASRRNNANI